MNSDSDIIYFPLGRACRISVLLRNNVLRHTALPFDWAVTPASGVKYLLSKQFMQWPNSEKLLTLEPICRILVIDHMDGADGAGVETVKILNDSMVMPVFDLETGILFPHEPPCATPAQAKLEFIKKYRRRALRASHLLRGGEFKLIGVRDDEIAINEFQAGIYQSILGVSAYAKLFTLDAANAAFRDSPIQGFEKIISFDDLSRAIRLGDKNP